MQNLFALRMSNEEEAKGFHRRNLIQETENVFVHFASSLKLLIVFAELAEADASQDHKGFINNTFIVALRSSAELQRQQAIPDWREKNNSNLVRGWFREIVKIHPDYKAMIDHSDPSEEEQRKFITAFFRRIIFGKTAINDFFSSSILRWSEDRDVTKGMVEHMIKAHVSGQPAKLPELSLNWDDDRSFLDRLYDGVVNISADHRKIIAENTRNWEVDRLPLTDQIILELAITELILFPHIPIKVTMNEYIELAKRYSTPKSWQFVNGILDVIVKELTQRGDILKSGRGLIDNK